MQLRKPGLAQVTTAQSPEQTTVSKTRREANITLNSKGWVGGKTTECKQADNAPTHVSLLATLSMVDPAKGKPDMHAPCIGATSQSVTHTQGKAALL